VGTGRYLRSSLVAKSAIGPSASLGISARGSDAAKAPQVRVRRPPHGPRPFVPASRVEASAITVMFRRWRTNWQRYEPRMTTGAFEFLGSVRVEPDAADCAVATSQEA
jgi:hypothetical protein